MISHTGHAREFQSSRTHGSAFKTGLGLLAWLSLACQYQQHTASGANDSAGEMSFDSRNTRPAFCARDGDDAIRDQFCTSEPPLMRSLADFQDLFDINHGPTDPDARPDPYAITASRGGVAVLGHSTASYGALVSPINPRAIFMGQEILLAYQRGLQQLEIAARVHGADDFNFYLLSFEQACNQRAHGCGPGDLYTLNVEREWTRVTLRDDEDLKNTASDCRQCHCRAGDKCRLLMRELYSPWTHFLFATTPPVDLPGVTGSDLTIDYLAAKQDELYAGVSVDALAPTAPFILQVIARSDQPLVFESATINDERWPRGPDGYPPQPGPSPTWEAAYEAFKRGEQLALPYLEPRAVDTAKQSEVARAYRRYRAGEIEADELPELADIFPDDPHVRARIGLQTEPDATPEDALIQACGPCHNDVLDQTLSRARFTIAVSRLGRAELDIAIDRIQREQSSPGAMPPPESRQLSGDVRARLLEYLRQDFRTIPVDPRLERAAALGMAGVASDRN